MTSAPRPPTGRCSARSGDPELMVATTNYDRAGETGLWKMGRQVTTGFPPHPERTATLQPQGMVENRGSLVPFIHLHGAVGWYEMDRQGGGPPWKQPLPREPWQARRPLPGS